MKTHKKMTRAQKIAANAQTSNAAQSPTNAETASASGTATASAEVPVERTAIGTVPPLQVPQLSLESRNPVVAGVRAGIEEQKRGVNVLEMKPEALTPEAKAWVNNPASIPGCVYLSLEPNGAQIEKPCPPVRFIGWGTLDEIFAARSGKQIDLKEIQHLVKTDGGLTKCIGTLITFQPLQWVKYCPRDLQQQLASGKELFDIEFEWAGAFFWMENLEESRAFSGSQFRSNGQLSHGSPLIMAAAAQAKAIRSTNRHVWGKSRGAIASWIQQRKANRRPAQSAAELVKSRIDDAFGIAARRPNFGNQLALVELSAVSQKPGSNGNGDHK